MTTEDLIRINREYFCNLVSQGLKTTLLAYFPFLLAPPFPYFIDLFLDWLVKQIAEILEQAAFFVYTDFRVSAQGKAYVEAKLKGFKAEMSGSLEDIKRTQDEIKNAFRTFAKFNR